MSRRRGHGVRPGSQPSEFLLGPDPRVLHATYSSGPIGRIAADDVV